jgi:hypothetical protein
MGFGVGAGAAGVRSTHSHFNGGGRSRQTWVSILQLFMEGSTHTHSLILRTDCPRFVVIQLLLIRTTCSVGSIRSVTMSRPLSTLAWTWWCWDRSACCLMSSSEASRGSHDPGRDPFQRGSHLRRDRASTAPIFDDNALKQHADELITLPLTN